MFQGVLSLLLLVVGLSVTPPVCAQGTNLAPAGLAATNAALNPSNAELQGVAYDISIKLALLALLALLGGLVISGFAVYGAYRAFGLKGVICMGFVIILIFILIGSILFESF
jgi:hypothetical protein